MLIIKKPNSEASSLAFKSIITHLGKDSDTKIFTEKGAQIAGSLGKINIMGPHNNLDGKIILY